MLRKTIGMLRNSLETRNRTMHIKEEAIFAAREPDAGGQASDLLDH